MIARVVLTAAADADADAIYAFLNAKAGKPIAVKYRLAFRALYEHLAEFPDSGAPRPKIGSEIRIGIVHPYIVIYKPAEGDGFVKVLRIVYGSRKITGTLLRGAT